MNALKNWFLSKKTAVQVAIIAAVVIVLLALFARDADAGLVGPSPLPAVEVSMAETQGYRSPRQHLPDGDIATNLACSRLEHFAETIALPFSERAAAMRAKLDEGVCMYSGAQRMKVSPIASHGTLTFLGMDGAICKAEFFSLERTPEAKAKGLPVWYTFVDTCTVPETLRSS